MSLKVGDRVRVVRDTCDHEFKIGSTRIISQVIGGFYRSYDDKNIADSGNYLKNEDVELLTNKKEKGFMSDLRTKFALLLKGEPEKSFNKAGITDSGDILTEEGKDVFLSWLLKQNGAAFKKEVVDELLKKDKKCEEKE